jgi:SAM-dependent methyltransferase
LLEIRAIFGENLPMGKTFRHAHRSQLARKINRKIWPEEMKVLEIGCGTGGLLALLSGQKTGVEKDPVKTAEASKASVDSGAVIKTGDITDPEVQKSLGQGWGAIIISDTLSHTDDAYEILRAAHNLAEPDTRLVITYHNNLWRPILELGHKLGLNDRPAQTWLDSGDIRNFCELSGWELIQREETTLIPLDGPISQWVNRWLAPLAPWVCLNFVVTARKKKERKAKKISIVVPARNEAGNIKAAVERTPDFGCPTELLFVEGGSTDNTWEEIEKLPEKVGNKTILKMKQTGKGKGDAVRVGFGAASGDLLLILDADLTVPPEELPKFIQAMERGDCEMANGSRLVYLMEQKAMQFANLIANKSFGIIFSWLMGQRLKDTLCGTKVLWKEDYERIVSGRGYFGEFDPFGDFDLLFGAARLGLKIRDIPVHYKERVYGTTNISRWKHGVILLGMTLVAAKKLKFS